MDEPAAYLPRMAVIGAFRCAERRGAGHGRVRYIECVIRSPRTMATIAARAGNKFVC